MSKQSAQKSQISAISLQNLEFVVPENLLKVVSLIDRGTGMNFDWSGSGKPDVQQVGVRVDKDVNGDVKFSVKSGNFQVLENGLKCVLRFRDITNTTAAAPVTAMSTLTNQPKQMLTTDGTHNPDGPGGDGDKETCVKQRRRGHPQSNLSLTPPLTAPSVSLASAVPLGDSEELSVLHQPHELVNVEYQSVANQTAACDAKDRKIHSEKACSKRSLGVSLCNSSDVKKTKNIESPMPVVPIEQNENDLTMSIEQKDDSLLSLQEALEETSKNISKLSASPQKLDPSIPHFGEVQKELHVHVIKGPEPSDSTAGRDRFNVRQIPVNAGRLNVQVFGNSNVSPHGARLNVEKVVPAIAHKQDDAADTDNLDEDVNLDVTESDPVPPAESRPSKTNYRREKNVQCRLCDRRVKSYDSLYEHVQRLHTDHKERDSYMEVVKDLKKVSCSLCGKVLSQQAELKHHMENMHGPCKEPNVNFSCHDCNKSFRDQKHLSAHFVRAHPRARVLCHLCPASFKTKVYLKEHIAACHEKKISHECNVCGKKFISRSSWVRHRGRHTNKKYHCPHCDRGFFEKTNMLRHVQTIHELGHSTKKVTCEHCKKSFTNQGNLRQHVKTIHFKDYAYTCDSCGKGFLRQKTLLEHVKSHHRLRDVKPEISDTNPLIQDTLSAASAGIQGKDNIENVSVVKYEVLDRDTTGTMGTSSSGQVVIPPDNASLQDVYVLITQDESGDNTDILSKIEQTPDLSNIQFVQPSITDTIRIEQSAPDPLASSNFQLQQILDLAQLQTSADQQIQIQDVTQEMAGLLDGVQIHIPGT